MRKLASVAYSAMTLFLLAPCLAQPSEAEVLAFVSQAFPNGVPYEEARALGPDASKILLKLLVDDAHWAKYPMGQNIVVTLGALADKQAPKPLRKRLEEGKGAIASDTYRNKSAVLMAFGYHLVESHDKKILKYLKDGATPSAWEKLAWLAPWQADKNERNRDLAELAVLSLALSGDDSLESWFANARALEAGGVRATVIQQAQATYKTVRAVGLRSYDRDASLQWQRKGGS